MLGRLGRLGRLQRLGCLGARQLSGEASGSGSKGPLSAPLYVAVAKMWGMVQGSGVVGEAELTVAQILEARRPERRTLFAVGDDDSAHSALELMLENHVSCVAVVRDEAHDSVVGAPPALVGMLTLSDFLQRVALPRADAEAMSCREAMTPADEVAFVFGDNSVQSCLSIMAEVRCHHLPVLSGDPGEGGVLLGVVSMEELLGLTAEARRRSRGALADAIARLPGLAFVGRSEHDTRQGGK